MFVHRLSAVIVSALATMAFVTVATPGVSSADCDNGWYWDPVGNVCRSYVPLDCENGWWWDPVANVCRAPVATTPLACDSGWWWDPVANVCRPVIP
jgi:hypothetical protein